MESSSVGFNSQPGSHQRATPSLAPLCSPAPLFVVVHPDAKLGLHHSGAYFFTIWLLNIAMV